MDREDVLRKIRQIARANNGSPPGIQKFCSRTGIRQHQVIGVLWPRWSDALREAGFDPNQMQQQHNRADLLDEYAVVARRLGRLPTKADLGVEHRRNPDLPSVRTWDRLGDGRKATLVGLLEAHCSERPGYADVLSMCKQYAPKSRTSAAARGGSGRMSGCVYLIKSGRFYKIGRTNAPGRREYELALQLPQRPRKIHEIRTDDPVGIESYWHKRFEKCRKNGEWFQLSADDVAAFKSKRLM